MNGTRKSAVILMGMMVMLMASPGAFAKPGKGKGAGSGPPKMPPPAKIPGLTVDDKHPNACVDCHVNMVKMKMDVRLSTLLKKKVSAGLLKKAQAAAPEGVKLKGKHPKVKVAGKQVPKSCLGCHKETSKKAPPFARLMHQIHLIGGKDNHFMTIYQGQCTECHKLDKSTGAWSVPSGKEK